MPFKSEAQRRYMHANMPEIAKRWEKEEKTPEYQAMKRRLASKQKDKK